MSQHRASRKCGLGLQGDWGPEGDWGLQGPAALWPPLWKDALASLGPSSAQARHSRTLHTRGAPLVFMFSSSFLKTPASNSV